MLSRSEQTTGKPYVLWKLNAVLCLAAQRKIHCSRRVDERPTGYFVFYFALRINVTGRASGLFQREDGSIHAGYQCHPQHYTVYTISFLFTNYYSHSGS